MQDQFIVSPAELFILADTKKLQRMQLIFTEKIQRMKEFSPVILIVFKLLNRVIAN